MAAPLPCDGQAAPEERAAEFPPHRRYLFRGDDNYRGGPVGLAFGSEADAADIQNFADHVLRKESSRTSRYVSFTEEVRVARRFTSAADDRRVRKVEAARLRELMAQGIITQSRTRTGSTTCSPRPSASWPARPPTCAMP